ncbi:retrovirus-related pol polyprotein from transposon TNT 1-94, partial [Tanacetum coccineum]
MIVAGARETVGSEVVQQNRIQCFNYKGFGHYAKECRKPKRVKDSSYHKEKMMMCKQPEHGVSLQAEQADWLAHYSFMAKIQEVLPEESSSTVHFQKTKVILDLKVKEEKDIDKMIDMAKQLNFLNEIVYTRNQSIQTIHMLAPKCSTFNGRPTFANLREETMTLANESRSKLNKD